MLIRMEPGAMKRSSYLGAARRSRPGSKPPLRELARAHFARQGRALTEPEVRLYDAVEADEVAIYVRPGPKWDRTLPAAALGWLCTDPEAKARVGRQGIRIVGARIEQAINLDAIDVRFALVWWSCTLGQPLSLVDARVGGLYFNGSALAGLNADRIKITGGVHLKHGFRNRGPMVLRGATIGGDLGCTGGRFENEKGDALAADGAKVTGNVYLNAEGRHRFHANGRVRLVDTMIGCDLVCRGGRFENPENDANSRGYALAADGAKITRNVFLIAEGRHCFHVSGTVSLAGVTIGGQFGCSTERFEGSLILQLAVIKGSWIFGRLHRPGGPGREEQPIGILSLVGAHAAVIVDDAEAYQCFDSVRLQGFTYGGFAGDAPTDAKTRLESFIGRQSKEALKSPQPYEQLSAVLRRAGHRRDAEEVLIAYRRAERHRLAQNIKAVKYLSQWWQKSKRFICKRFTCIIKVLKHLRRWRCIPDYVWSRLYDLLLGYGYRWTRPFWISVVLVILSTGLFWLAYEKDGIVAHNKLAHVGEGPYIDKAEDGAEPVLIDQRGSGWYPTFNPLIYALDVYVPLVDLEQTKYWQPIAKKGGWGWGATWLMRLNIAAGWLFTTLFVAGLATVVRREGGESSG